MAIISLKRIIIVSCAILIGLQVVAPSIGILISGKSWFKNVWPEYNGDRLYYFARIQEVVDGHDDISHPYFIDKKNIPYPQATLLERAVGELAVRTGIPVPDLQIIFDFIFPVLIFLITYVLMTQLEIKSIYAIGLSALLYLVDIGAMLKPIHPQASIILLLIFLSTWVAVIKKSVSTIYLGIPSLLLGLLFLSYFYHWSFVLVVLGIYAILLLMTKRYLELKKIIFVVLGGIIIGLPYFLMVYKGINAPFHGETSIRVGVYYSHLPESIPRLFVAILWLSFFSWWGYITKTFSTPSFRAIFSLLAANVIFPNHQVISGLIIQNANHWSFMPILLYSISGGYVLSALSKYSKKAEPFFLVAMYMLVIVLVLTPIIRLASFKPSHQELFTSEELVRNQSYRDVFDWLNTRPKDSVVYGPNQLMEYIPAYTHSNVYNSKYAFNLPGSDREVVERALLSHFFEPEFFNDPKFGMTEDTRILWTQPAQTERNINVVNRLLRLDQKEKYLLDREVQYVFGVYQELKKAQWNIMQLKRYTVDYIVWDRIENPEWRLDKYKEIREVYSTGPYTIYSYK